MTVVSLAYGVSAFLLFFGIFLFVSKASFMERLCRLLRNDAFSMTVFWIGGVWFLWHVGHLAEADFGAYRHWFLLLFGGILVSCCIYWRDWLSVRGIALITLLSAHYFLSIGYMQTDRVHPWLSLLFYIFIVAALFFGVYPYRVRDLLNWAYKKTSLWPFRCLGLLSVFYAGFLCLQCSR